MTRYSEKLHAPFVFYTRFGIGIFDEAWLDFRIRAFGAFTLPSVTRQLRHGDRWYIFVDRDMPEHRLAEFRRLIDGNPASSAIVLVFVRYAFAVADALEDQLRNDFRDAPIYLTRIDDDDAIRHDALHLFVDLALRDDVDEMFMSATSAMEFFPVERLVLEGRHDLLLNVVYGKAHVVSGFARVGHTRLRAWAEERSMSVSTLDPKHVVFLYNRHRQSSSRFASRRHNARTSSASRTWLSSDFRAFNLDFDRLLEFRAFAAASAYASEGSAWTDSDRHTAAALRHWEQLVAEKRAIISSRVTLLQSDHTVP